MSAFRLVAGSLGVALLCGWSIAHASTVWNEAINGDLSNDGLAPTAVPVQSGSNVVLGSTGNAGAGVDRDYFRLTVPTGSVLSSILLLSNTTIAGSTSFIGLQAGPQLTVLPNGVGAASLLGFAHYNINQVGTNLLPAVLGSASPLTAGTYSVWVQETGGPVTYGFDFGITPVPVPGAALTFCGALVSLFGLRRRRAANPPISPRKLA